MRLFSLPDGAVDRKDRAQWVTVPFDLAFGAPVVNRATPWCVNRLSAYLPNVQAGQASGVDIQAAQAYLPTIEAAQGVCA